MTAERVNARDWERVGPYYRRRSATPENPSPLVPVDTVVADLWAQLVAIRRWATGATAAGITQQDWYRRLLNDSH